MASWKSVSLCLLTLISACANYQHMSKVLNYDEAIEDVLLISDGERGYEFKRCINNWNVYEQQRRLLLDELLRNRILDQDRFLIIEIGNAGFPRYDYVYIVNDLMSASLIREGIAKIGIAETKLSEKLKNLSGTDVAMMHGHVSSNIDDGDCYFLTVKQHGNFKQVAIYGELSSQSNASVLTREVLSSIRDLSS